MRPFARAEQEPTIDFDDLDGLHNTTGDFHVKMCASDCIVRIVYQIPDRIYAKKVLTFVVHISYFFIGENLIILDDFANEDTLAASL